ncbi:VOC family protein [Nocardia sp. NPDC052566]|uniref:VOC family protein n=1 Tax=Nocardia sp. NPDC052566 TaxID=3364330 RepID=UPI0037C96ABF
MTTLLPAYHIGIVVADLERSMLEMSETLGVEWHTPFDAPTQILADGAVTTTVSPRLAYSKQGPAYLELLERVPDTIWDTPGLHHIGLWADDVPTESDRLATSGLPIVQRDLDMATGATICYHRTSDNLLLEITDIGRAGPSVANYLSGAYDKLLRGN